MLRLAVDIDGVCADFNTEFKKVLDVFHGTEVDAVVDVWHWDQKYYSKEVCKKAWDFVRITNPHWWLSLEPLYGMEHLVQVVNREKAEVIFPTNRSFDGATRISTAWFENQGMFNPQAITVKNKAEVVAGLGVDAFIDDNADNCLNTLKKVGAHGTRVYLLKAAYNTELWTNKHIIGVSSLREFLEKEGLL